MNLQHKHILITGGANGIGKALVEDCVQLENMKITIFDNDIDALDIISKRHPQILCKHCDITNPILVQDSVAEVFANPGPIDILVNNAAIIHNEPLINSTKQGIKPHDIEAWNKVILTNLNAIFYVTSDVVSKMVMARTKGVVISISSICAAGNAGQGAYSAAKAGVNAATRSWAKELGPFNIRFVAIAPGFIATDTTRHVLNESQLKSWARKTPARRTGEIHEVVDTIKFAIRNDFVNGSVLEIDGGLRI